MDDMPINSDEGIREVLSSTKTIALVGASPNPQRASHAVMHYMLDRGYHVIPVNPTETKVLGRPAVASLADIRVPVDIVVSWAPVELSCVFQDGLGVKPLKSQMGALPNSWPNPPDRSVP